MADRVPGSTCQGTKPENVKDGGSALASTPSRGPTGTVWNLPGAKETLAPEFGACYPPVVTTLCLTSEEMQLLSALRSQRGNIIAQEQKFRVDRRAIAGAIAWEMMIDPMVQYRKYDPLPFRGMGWGQVHRYNIRKKEAPLRILGSIISGNPAPAVGIFDFDTMAKQVEAEGYLPPVSDEERLKICSSPEGSILYVAGIMAAIAEAPEKMGFEEDIRSNPAILANVYHGMTLKDWRAHLTKKMAAEGKGAVFEAGTDMGIWVRHNLAFLEEAVGAPDLPESAPGYCAPGAKAGAAKGAKKPEDKKAASTKLDKDKFAQWMDDHAEPQATFKCAKYVRQGLEAGGFSTEDRPVLAKDYGPFLIKLGATTVSQDNYIPQKGDLVVFEGAGDHPAGHLQMYDGTQWVSDFKQQNYNPFYGNDDTKSVVYRFP